MLPTEPLPWALDALPLRAERYRRYGAYYEGAHRFPFASERYRKDFGRMLAEARVNLCARVVDAHADRLAVVGFGDRAQAEANDAADRAWALWLINSLDLRQGEVYQEAFRAGDGYVLVWPREDARGRPVPRLYPQRADQVTVHYDDDTPGQIDAAAKAWKREDNYWRVTLYLPDRIEKYVSTQAAARGSGFPRKADSFQPYQPEGEPWPLPNPFGRVPMFHFGNNAHLGGFGRSELADVVPIQDALNKTAMDLLVTSEFMAYPQRWAVGVAAFTDPDSGEEVQPFQAGADRVWTVPAPDARFGEFMAANLNQLVSQKQELQLDIARVSSVPVHYLLMTGQYPSGESLKTAEAPFVAKLEDRQRAFGAVWADALAFALVLDGMGATELATRWAAAAPRSEQETWSVAQLKLAAGVSPDQVQREGGYSPEQIQSMKTESADAMAARGAVIPEAFA
ncbi:MAG TPA: phage portal protein [Tepidisphaeraceae bacterium]|jgi:hypothetical protein